MWACLIALEIVECVGFTSQSRLRAKSIADKRKRNFIYPPTRGTMHRSGWSCQWMSGDFNTYKSYMDIIHIILFTVYTGSENLPELYHMFFSDITYLYQYGGEYGVNSKFDLRSGSTTLCTWTCDVESQGSIYNLTWYFYYYIPW